jgi:hypothetical protein
MTLGKTSGGKIFGDKTSGKVMFDQSVKSPNFFFQLNLILYIVTFIKDKHNI